MKAWMFPPKQVINNVSSKNLMWLLKCLIPQAWSSFGAGCKKASAIFKFQTKDAYKFLEVSPSSLSKEQWQEEYESVKQQLQKINLPQSVTSSNTPAISQWSTCTSTSSHFILFFCLMMLVNWDDDKRCTLNGKILHSFLLNALNTLYISSVLYA